MLPPTRLPGRRPCRWRASRTGKADPDRPRPGPGRGRERNRARRPAHHSGTTWLGHLDGLIGHLLDLDIAESLSTNHLG